MSDDFKVEKNVPIPKREKKKKRIGTSRYVDKYKWITELDDGDSIVCNRRESQNIICFCKKWGIKTVQKWIDKRAWYEAGYSEDGKYRLWFYPSTSKKTKQDK